MTHRSVLLLHSIGLDAEAYDALRQALGAGLSFEVCELRGHGERAAQTDFALDDLVQDALAAIERSEVPVHLVGHSMGGAIAALAAARAGGRKVASLALVATPPAGVPAFDDRAAAAEQDFAASCEATFARWFQGESADTTEAKAAARRAMARVQPAGMAAAWRALASFPGHAAIAQPLPRTLCMAAADDASTPPQLMQRIVTARQDLQPGADIALHTIPGAGHMVPLTHPRPVAAMLAAHWNIS
jgi:3-oxoadipate enol-lactonase